MNSSATPHSSVPGPAHRKASAVAPHVRMLRLLITRVPTGTAVRVIAAVTATLSMIGILLFGTLSDTEFGPHMQDVITVGVVVPLIVVMPFASVAIQLVRQLEQERDSAIALADLDPLTGLINRRRFGELMEHDLAIAARGARFWMLAVIDIDDFKSVNDLHGHGAGDALLQAVAQTCRRTLRATDVVARWGGEEFVLMLPDPGADGGSALLERLRAAIATTVVRDGSNRPISRTVSIGGVVLPVLSPESGSPSARHLIGLADRAMYRAKALGKNRVVTERVPASGAAIGVLAGAPRNAPVGAADSARLPSRATRETV